MSEVLVIQHIDCETLGTIEEALRDKHVTFRYVRPYLGDRLPENAASLRALIVMGGPMGVYDAEQYPFLREELRLIRSAIDAGLPVLGICLGSQLLASALGARVAKGHRKEIGWYPIRLTREASQDPVFQVMKDGVFFHWHGDVFELPPGAVALAGSELTPLQAFRFKDNIYGCLFHAEVTAEMIREWVRRFDAELSSSGIDPAPILKSMDQHLPALRRAGSQLFTAWVERI